MYNIFVLVNISMEYFKIYLLFYSGDHIFKCSIHTQLFNKCIKCQSKLNNQIVLINLKILILITNIIIIRYFNGGLKIYYNLLIQKCLYWNIFNLSYFKNFNYF